MSLPSNVVRLSDLPWVDAARPREAYACHTRSLDALPLTTIGAHFVRLPAGKRSVVLHHHLREEEMFYVMSGSLRVHELLPEAQDLRTYDLVAGDLVAYPPGTWIAHQFEALEDCVFLALSNLVPGDVCVYPTSGKVMLRGMSMVGIWADHEPMIDIVREAAAHRQSVPATELPKHAVRAERVPWADLSDNVSGRALARKAGATMVMVNQDRLDPGGLSSPLHWHRFEEELVLVLDGTATLRQVDDGHEQRVTLSEGDLAHFAPNDQVAHQIINESGAPATLLVIGTHVADEVVVFPETERIYSRTLGHVGSLIERPYWDGE